MSSSRTYRTSEVAKVVGVHPNTVRMYETWGFIPAPARSLNGYRQYSDFHIDQMILARLALHGGWPGRKIRSSALHLVRTSSSGNIIEATKLAQTHLQLIRQEQTLANNAVRYLEKWAAGKIASERRQPITIIAAAKILETTVDTLRGWERNGLIKPPRDPRNRYRMYYPRELGKLRVIRMLLQTGFSTMAVLQMVRQLDTEGPVNLRKSLDTPANADDILSAADYWLSFLKECRSRAQKILLQTNSMSRKYPCPTLH